MSKAKTSVAKQLRGTSHVPRAVFYLRGISPECTAGDIEKYCAEREIRVSNCRILQTRRFGKRAARLSVAQIDAEKAEMLSENFWPEHISIRPWIFPEDGEIVERFESGGRRLRIVPRTDGVPSGNEGWSRSSKRWPEPIAGYHYYPHLYKPH